MSLEKFTKGFITAALRSSTYEHENCQACVEGTCNPNCDDGEHELSDDAEAYLNALALVTYKRIGYLLKGNYKDDSVCEYEYGGHDAWLTSQGHGTGFWDGDLIKHVDTICSACKDIIPEGLHFWVNADGEFDIE